MQSVYYLQCFLNTSDSRYQFYQHYFQRNTKPKTCHDFKTLRNKLNENSVHLSLQIFLVLQVSNFLFECVNESRLYVIVRNSVHVKYEY